MVDLGVDFSSSYEFQDGDLVLVEDKENITEAIGNRLNTEYDSMSEYYNIYGSLLRGFLGDPSDDRTLDFIQLEVESVLQQDPRLEGANVEVYRTDTTGQLIIMINNVYNDDEELELNLVLNEDMGVDISGS